MLDRYLRTAYAAALLLEPHRRPIEVPEFDEHAVYVPLSSMAWFMRESASLVAAVAAAGFTTHVWQLVWTMTDFFERHGQWRDYTGTAHVALSAAVRLRDTAAHVEPRAHPPRGSSTPLASTRSGPSRCTRRTVTCWR